MIVLSQADVRELLDLDGLVDVLADAMADLSAGRASLPPRTIAAAPDGILAAMSAYSGGVLATKLVTVFTGNHALGLPSHQAVIVVIDPSNGSPMALMDGTYITAVRTAAGTALSVRLLAREDASVLAVVGTGVQARAHLRAVPRVRTFREVRVIGRDRTKAAALADEFGAVVSDSIDGADVVCACTHASEPVVRRASVAAGAHVTSVGVNAAGGEVDGELVHDALVVVESRPAALGGPGAAGATELSGVDRSTLTEIGEILSGVRPGRTSDTQITLYKSVGVAVQDAAAASMVLAAARARGVGTTATI